MTGPTGYHRPVTSSVVDVLQEHYEQVKELFGRVSSPDEDRPAVLRQIIQSLAAEVAAERATLLPEVSELDLDEDLAGEMKDDYDRIENLLVLIERRKFNSPDVPDLVVELREVHERHAERAGRVLFPALRQQLEPAQLEELGERIAGEDAVVTSHPHPHLLSLGPAADILTRVAQKWDAARDRTARNRQHPEEGAEPSMGGST